MWRWFLSSREQKFPDTKLKKKKKSQKEKTENEAITGLFADFSSIGACSVLLCLWSSTLQSMRITTEMLGDNSAKMSKMQKLGELNRVEMTIDFVKVGKLLQYQLTLR